MTDAAALAVVAAWIDAFNAADLDRLVGLYADDATLLGTGSPDLLRGRAAIRPYFTGQGSMVLRDHVAHVLSDRSVLVAGFYDLHRPRLDPTSVTPARFTFLIERDGPDWTIRHHHSSVRPAG